jgi:hypothetical protein
MFSRFLYSYNTGIELLVAGMAEIGTAASSVMLSAVEPFVKAKERIGVIVALHFNACAVERAKLRSVKLSRYEKFSGEA